MMGAAWAYEALSFSGYWNWDPVENASLVPWLVLVAGLHTQVVYNATGHSLRATHFFFITQFMLVLYETFLTRSGILGDLSVHAFVESGMNVQLGLFVLVFLFPAYGLFISRYKKIPAIVKEESTDSREFWMFIGSLVLFLSAMFIIISTSLPIYNLLMSKKVSTGDDPTFAYNRIEIFIAILLGIFTAFAQFLKYKGYDAGSFPSEDRSAYGGGAGGFGPDQCIWRDPLRQIWRWFSGCDTSGDVCRRICGRGQCGLYLDRLSRQAEGGGFGCGACRFRAGFGGNFAFLREEAGIVDQYDWH
ncbi:cytochrome c biogenesis protein CcsA [Puia sp. P3]|uniref:cytochrome c biogenesis protein CcsA n=1 Tax=Puia sp. P3 TaxID=3423952 RepID=UPI003D66F0DF